MRETSEGLTSLTSLGTRSVQKREVTTIEEEHPLEAFTAHGADGALGEDMARGIRSGQGPVSCHTAIRESPDQGTRMTFSAPTGLADHSDEVYGTRQQRLAPRMWNLGTSPIA